MIFIYFKGIAQKIHKKINYLRLNDLEKLKEKESAL